MVRSLFTTAVVFITLVLANCYYPPVNTQFAIGIVVVSFVATVIGLLMRPDLIRVTPHVYIVYPAVVVAAALICTTILTIMVSVTVSMVGQILGLRFVTGDLALFSGIVSAIFVTVGTFCCAMVIEDSVNAFRSEDPSR